MDKKKILAHKPKKCYPEDTNCNEEDFELFVSTDFGTSWKKILDHVIEASWYIILLIFFIE
jgi:hypothetical protein